MLHEDNHIENIAFIEYIEEGKKKIRLAPNFDCEATFLLDSDEDLLKRLLEDYVGFKQKVNMAHPRIGTVVARSVRRSQFFMERYIGRTLLR
jgi:hypothetical protein